MKKATLFLDTKWKIKLDFPFRKNDVKNIKKLNNWEFKNNLYYVSLNNYNINRLIEFGFYPDEKLKKLYKKLKPKQKVYPIMEVEGLENILRDYQKQAVYFIEKNKGRSLLADSMGLGKTFTSLAWVKHHTELKKIIIICPSSVKMYWEREILKFINPNIYILDGFPKEDTNLNKFKTHSGKSNLDIIIVNYKIWSNDFTKENNRKKEVNNTGWADLISENTDLLLIDEAHYLSNDKSNRTKTTKRISRNIKHILLLTGTPLENKPIDIFPLIDILDKNLFKNKWDFTKKFCNPFLDTYGWNYNGSNNTDLLHKILVNTYMIRRLKKEVAKELPEKQKIMIPVKLKNMENYNKGNYREEIQFIIDNKIEHTINWIKEYLTNGGKLVVFARHKKVIKKIMGEFKGISVKIDGEVSSKNRQKVIDKFINNDKIKLFVGNIKASGTGIDGLQKVCSNILFAEFIYNPMLMEQAADRLYRIGQINNVNIYYLISVGTIEEKIVQDLDNKRKIIDKTVDNVITDYENLFV